MTHFLIIQFFLNNRTLQSEDLHRSRGIARSEFPPLPKIPYCCLPQESGPCLSPSVAVQPLSSAKHRRLGEPLPHQLANAPQGHPLAFPCRTFKYQKMPSDILSSFSYRFQQLSSTKGQVPHVLLTRSPLGIAASFDLHVLGMPPALILSQDQTLKKFYPNSTCYVQFSKIKYFNASFSIFNIILQILF